MASIPAHPATAQRAESGLARFITQILSDREQFFTEVVEVSSARWSIERFEHYPAFGKTYAIGQ